MPDESVNDRNKLRKPNSLADDKICLLKSGLRDRPDLRDFGTPALSRIHAASFGTVGTVLDWLSGCHAMVVRPPGFLIRHWCLGRALRSGGYCQPDQPLDTEVNVNQTDTWGWGKSYEQAAMRISISNSAQILRKNSSKSVYFLCNNAEGTRWKTSIFFALIKTASLRVAGKHKFWRKIARIEIHFAGASRSL